MKIRLALLAGVVLALTACEGPEPGKPTPTPDTQLAACTSAAVGCVITGKNRTEPKMEADYDRKCVKKNTAGKCTQYKNVFDEMEEVEPAHFELCANTPDGPRCQRVDKIEYDSYQVGQNYTYIAR